MITEYAQILSTAHRISDGTKTPFQVYKWGHNKLGHKVLKKIDWLHLPGDEYESVDGFMVLKSMDFYRPTHVTHPSSQWVRTRKEHYDWLYDLFCHLLDKFKEHKGYSHACDRFRSRGILKDSPKNILKNLGWVDPPACMPEEFIIKGNIAESYRNYINEKFIDWSTRDKKIDTSYFEESPPDWVTQKGKV